MAALHTRTTTHTQRSTHSAVLPAGLRGASLRAIKSRSSNAAAVSSRKQARLVAVRAAAEEKGENRACGHLWCITTTTPSRPGVHCPNYIDLTFLASCTAVEEVQLGKAAAVAPQGDNWVPVCRPEDLPKGESLPAFVCHSITTLHIRSKHSTPRGASRQAKQTSHNASPLSHLWTAAAADSGQPSCCCSTQVSARSSMSRAGRC